MPNKDLIFVLMGQDVRIPMSVIEAKFSLNLLFILQHLTYEFSLQMLQEFQLKIVFANS